MRSHSQHTLLWLWKKKPLPMAPESNESGPYGGSPGRDGSGRQEGEGTHHSLDVL